MSDKESNETTTEHDIGLVNPYPPSEVNYNEGTGVRICGVVSEEDAALLKLVTPKRGIPVIMINMYIKSICDQMREEDLTYFSPENRERFYEIVRSRCTHS